MGRHSFFSSTPKQPQTVAVEYNAIRGAPYYQSYQAYQPPPPYQAQHVASQVAVNKKKQQLRRLSPLMIPIQPGSKPICISQSKQLPQVPPQRQHQQQQQQQWQGPYFQHRPQSYQPPRQTQQPQQQPQRQQQQTVPAALAVPRPLSHVPQERLRSEQAPQSKLTDVPSRPAPRPPKAVAKVEDDIDFFEFQYPCMLPPETITLARPVSKAVANEATPTGPSPRYSLPVLPSESPRSPGSLGLKRSKPYLQSRRQRMPTRDSVRPLRRTTRDDLHGVAPAVQGVFSLEKPERKDSGQWYDFVEESTHGGRSADSGDSTPTPVARPETPLEYRAQQAAALHDLLGQVLAEDLLTGTGTGDKKEAAAGMTASPSAVWDDIGITILEEEVELAARGYRKFSAEEYMRELREVLNSFDSPI